MLIIAKSVLVTANHFPASTYKTQKLFCRDRGSVSGDLIKSCFIMEKSQKIVLEVHVGTDLHLEK